MFETRSDVQPEGFKLFEAVSKNFGEDFTFAVGDVAFHPFEILRSGCPSSILTSLQHDSPFAPDHRLRQLADLCPPSRIKKMGAVTFLGWLNRKLDDKLGNPLEIIHNHLMTL